MESPSYVASRFTENRRRGEIKLTLFSICIPTYNRCKKLERCLLSVLPQAVKYNVPIYVSDNASSDATSVLLSKLKLQYPDLLIVKRQKSTVNIDQNMLDVLSMSSAQYALWLGDDDTLAPNALQIILSALQNQPDLCVLGLEGHSLQDRYEHADEFFRDYGLVGLNLSMHFSTLIVDVQAIKKLPNALRFKGTMHLYAGCVLDYLALQEQRKGHVSVYLLPSKLLNLSKARKKSWSQSKQSIYLQFIPTWISQLHEYYHKSRIGKKRMSDYYEYIYSPIFLKIINVNTCPSFLRKIVYLLSKIFKHLKLK